MSRIFGRTSGELSATQTRICKPEVRNRSGVRSQPMARGGEAAWVLIRDPDGGTLTTARIRLDGSRLIILSDIREPDALMAYYFLKGGSLVAISVGGHSADGRLDTRWLNGSRTWMVRLATPVDSRAPRERPEPSSSAQPGSSAALR